MSKPDPYSDWVINSAGPDGAYAVPEELVVAAREAWPHILAHARREISDKSLGIEITSMAAEVWEQVLHSVTKTLHRRSGDLSAITDLRSYLIGIFHHRFNRALKKERVRAQRIYLVPLIRDLERLQSTQDQRWASDLERAITLDEIVRQMDDWTRRVWRARQLGASWKEIADKLGQNQQQTKMRFRYGLSKIRDRLTDLSPKHKSKGPSQP
jgi:DNA-directed RNA polymerase specialized sigma24 family protein